MTDVVFERFDQTDAYKLGTAMHDEAVKRNYPIVIDIRRGETPMFSVMLPGAGELNFDWARRKRNLTLLTGVASWTHAENLASGDDVIENMGLDPRDYTPHGGCVPIRVTGVGIVATVTISGLPQKEDHDFAVACLLDYRDHQTRS